MKPKNCNPMSDESTKSAVLAKCEGYKPQLRNQLMPIEGTELTIKQYKERGSVCHEISNRSNSVFLQIRPSDPAESDVWGIAADILKITPSIDEFEDDLSRRQYHHDLEVARMEGYEQGKAEALEKTLKDAENELFQLIMAEIGSSFHTSIIHTIRKLKEPPRPSDALLLKCWDTAIQHSRRATTTGSISSDEGFFDWLATIPPDTLKADRELVKNIFRVSNTVKVSRGTKLWETIARLAGMEAPNE